MATPPQAGRFLLSEYTQTTICQQNLDAFALGLTPPSRRKAKGAIWLLTFHCLIGVVAAVLAHRKGYSLGLWIVLGLIVRTAALIAALLMKEK